MNVISLASALKYSTVASRIVGYLLRCRSKDDLLRSHQEGMTHRVELRRAISCLADSVQRHSSISIIQENIVDVLFALINNHYETLEPHTTDPLYRCMAFLSIDPDHATHGRVYQPIGHIACNFSAVQWVLRLSVFAKIHRLHSDRPISKLSSNPTVEEIRQAEALADELAMHPDAAQGTSDTGLQKASILDTLKTTGTSSFGLFRRTFLGIKKVLLRQHALPSITWDTSETMALRIIRPGPMNGTIISQNNLSKGFWKLVHKLEAGISKCLFQHTQGVYRLRHFNPSAIDHLRVSDDVNNLQPGHSFLASDDFKGHRFDLLNAIIKEKPQAIFNTAVSHIPSLPIKQRIDGKLSKGSKPTLDKQKVGRYLDAVADWSCNLAKLMQLAGGTPSRCPQMEGLLVENTKGRRRNILCINELLLWVTFDDTKCSSVTGRDKTIPHWFPKEVQSMVRSYLVFIRPFIL